MILYIYLLLNKMKNCSFVVIWPNNHINGIMVSMLASSAVFAGSRSGQVKQDYKIGICCISTKYAALRRKSKHWLARNQSGTTCLPLTLVLYKTRHLRKPKGQSRMDNPKTLVTLGTRHTGQRQIKQTKTQHRKLKRWAEWTPLKTRSEPMCSQIVSSFSLL